MKEVARLIFFLTVIIFLQSCKKGCTDPTAVNYDPDAKKIMDHATIGIYLQTLL